MNADLLCPGPSLAGYRPAGRGLVLGVNRAAIARPCGVWVCGDTPAVLRYAPAVQGSPRLVTYSDALSELGKAGMPWRGPVTVFEDFAEWCRPWETWRVACETTAMWALLYAAYAGAVCIDCYGIDWAGLTDWDGTHDGGNRSGDRWAAERAVWENLLVPWLNGRGITVRGYAQKGSCAPVPAAAYSGPTGVP